MKFINKANDSTYSYDNKIVLLNDEEVKKELLIENYKNNESQFVFVINEEEIKIYDCIQIKVNIKNVGFIIASYNLNDFKKEDRTALTKNLLSLKDIDVTNSVADLEEKIKSTIDFIKEYHPYFITFQIERFIHDVEKLLLSLDGLYIFPIFYIKAEKKKEEIEEFVPIEATTINIGFDDEDEKKKPFKVNLSNFKNDFKKELKTIAKYKIEHLFNALYCALLSLCLVLMVIFFDNNKAGYGVLFLFFILLFTGLLSYNIYLFKEEIKRFNLFDYIAIGLFSILSVTIGILLGWLLANSLLKFDNPINFQKAILTASLIAPVVVISSHFISLLIKLIAPRIKKLFKKK